MPSRVDAKERTGWRTGKLAGAAALVVSLSIGFVSGPAVGATGDSLISFDASATAGIPPCASGIGTGLAYDGTDLILSCWGSNVLERVNATTHLNSGSVTISGLPFGDDIEALAWDASRSRLWACNAHGAVVLIDVGAGMVDSSQPPFVVPGCTDGLAYDGSDDTLWLSPDADPTTYHYTLSGTLIDAFSNAGLIGGCGNSGIAVGGPNLYLANNGCSEIYSVAKDFTSSALFAGFPARLEDLECDGRTFSPVGAIWSIDAYDRTLNAWEIPPGLCAFGGLARCGDGTLDPGEQCDDGNLLNGDGCDSNCQLEPARCGDGQVDPGEECDDGNTVDGDGCSSSCKIENQPPDCSGAAASVEELWPPNHQFVPVSVVGVTDPDGDPVAITITGIAQDEPLNTVGDGNTCPDGDGVATSTALLRAERAGTPKVPGDGRVYHVGFTASDGKGGECSGMVNVCVPHDQRRGHVCVDQGPLVDSTGPCS